MKMLGSRPGGGEPRESREPRETAAAGAGGGAKPQQAKKSGGAFDQMDDDIPF